jgi:hypothetical protein
VNAIANLAPWLLVLDPCLRDGGADDVHDSTTELTAHLAHHVQGAPFCHTFTRHMA